MSCQNYKIKGVCPAGEKGTYIVEISFFDESTPPQAITPNLIVWSLFDSSGNIINNNTSIPITPSQVVNIVLTNDDLEVLDENDLYRTILLEYTYNSAYGNNLPIRVEYIFKIQNLENVNGETEGP